MSRSTERLAYAVVDLGFGDAGKGLLVDYLARDCQATTIVRFNGGAQAGHNVVTVDGRQHTFAQFGATFLPGVTTLLSRDVLVHPTALLAEARALERHGVRDPLSRVRISEAARVITPFHQALNRIRECALGTGRHGSCGVGVGETVDHSIRRPGDALLMGTLSDMPAARRKLSRIHGHALAEVQALGSLPLEDPAVRAELGILRDPSIPDIWLEQLQPLLVKDVVVTEEIFFRSLRESSAIVLEGAQGVLLDEVHGFYPFNSWSDCTFRRAVSLLSEAGWTGTLRRVGVLRCLPIRHGPGPFPTETDSVSAAIREPHNRQTRWQGSVRYGWFDAVLGRYALEVLGGVDTLAITHLDALSRLEQWRLCDAYQLNERTCLTRLAVSAESLTPLLEKVKPIWSAEFNPREPRVLERIEAALGVDVSIGSRGPCASDVFRREQLRVRRRGVTRAQEDLPRPAPYS